MKKIFILSLSFFLFINLGYSQSCPKSGTEDIDVTFVEIENTPLYIGKETTAKVIISAGNGITLCKKADGSIEQPIKIKVSLDKFEFVEAPTVGKGLTAWKLDEFDSSVYRSEIVTDQPQLFESEFTVKIRPTEPSTEDQSVANTGNKITVRLETHAGDPNETSDDNNIGQDINLDNSYTCHLAKDTYPPNSPCYKIIDSILPVELTLFTAKAKGSDAVLNWETATEANSSHFNVQRSFDGVAFTTIGKVESAGTTQAAHAYSFTDRNASAKASTLYYRLQQVDIDATTSTSEIRVVNFTGEVESKIYPNPVEIGKEVYVQGNSIQKISVITPAGKTIAQYEVNGENIYSFSTEEFSAGAYILIVDGEESNLIVQ